MVNAADAAGAAVVIWGNYDAQGVQPLLPVAPGQRHVDGGDAQREPSTALCLQSRQNTSSEIA